MRGNYVILLGCLSLLHPSMGHAQDTYVKETDPLVVQKLEAWQDLKFGFMMHWGPYSQWGAVESWTLCPEDQPWCRRTIDNYCEYVTAYENLQKTFNPVYFDPAAWASLAREAGMKYLIFSTKHHDGFSMFDTKLTRYRITDPSCPFHTSPKANVTKELFDAFRKEGFMIGAYFSKPDWHSDDYWWPYFPSTDRNVNYDPAKYAERWQRFKDFVYGQIEELMTVYGPVDILWLDGGWVRPMETINDEVRSWGAVSPYNQDIDMPRIAGMARQHQPGLIIVDRSVSGKYENYTTPEQQIPDKPLDYPWETCMTMAGQWSYNPNDQYKSTRQIIHNLVDIVAKGGNYLLNVGPSPDGTLPQEAVQRMKEIGVWMKINGEAIYETRPVAPYKEGNICYTFKKNGNGYAIILMDEKEPSLPKSVSLPVFSTRMIRNISMLGYYKPLKWKDANGRIVVSLPEKVRTSPPSLIACTLRIEYQP
jgi:alpha-L-fucosidase